MTTGASCSAVSREQVVIAVVAPGSGLEELARVELPESAFMTEDEPPSEST